MKNVVFIPNINLGNGRSDNYNYSIKDITHVILTHLHFDHAGGGVSQDIDGTFKPSISKTCALPSGEAALSSIKCFFKSSLTSEFSKFPSIVLNIIKFLLSDPFFFYLLFLFFDNRKKIHYHLNLYFVYMG